MRTLEYAVVTILALVAAYWVATSVASAVSSSMESSAAMIRDAGQ